VYYRK